MSTSKQNDNGRYFEFLVTKNLVDSGKVTLTERALKDQERDSSKKVTEKNLLEMQSAAIKISSWLSKQLTLNKNTILDRLPDKNITKTHEDISLQDQEGKVISFSLKHNHEAIFHGRILSCNNWLGMSEENKFLMEFNKNKKNIIQDVQKKIPIGIQFAEGGILEEYRETWSEFIFKIHEEAKTFLSHANNKKVYLENLFNTIIGSGGNQYRVLKKNKKVFVQNLSNLQIPDSVEIDNFQKPTKDIRSSYVWHLKLKFSNGLIVEGRNKQDSRFMSKTPKIKPDWVVKEWGESGIEEEEI